MSLALKRAREVSIGNKIILAFGMAVLTGILAQVKLFLPFTPVPVTCQTFAALLAGVALGRYWGGISQIIYVSLFAGFGAIMGPTGGYLLGFILAALFVGHVTDKYGAAKGFYQMLCVMAFANFILIYVPGIIQLNIWLYLFKGESSNFSQLIYAGVAPFIIGDTIKIISAALIARAVIPK
ncbi:MAG: biotin transporter BioY [Candidatus Omnitrophota bacterium]|nr:biotin transporter BioY [Candidatus Omnitrophota bacterium]